MHLLIDSKIPYMRGLAEELGTVTYLDGAAIGPDDVREADALIVRTRTHCNRELLEGSRVQFIATATIGFDHIDTDYLAAKGIDWANCPGCNAGSVAQYVECALLLLSAHGCWSEEPLTRAEEVAGEPDKTVFSRLTLGIVGAGHVGTAVERMARRLGFGRILRCDPPRAEREPHEVFLPLEEMAPQCDIISFHTPLTHAPTPHPTYHLADARLLSLLKPGAVLFNTSRGEVADTQALKAALREGRLRTAVINTWENEPNIDRELLDLVFLGTPHIAGYSADGKATGTRMALEHIVRHFELDSRCYERVVPPALPAGYRYFPEGAAANTSCKALHRYDPTRDFLALKAHPELFESLRGNYPLRREK